jgi:murein DD-endopeptidase MepM/ murein hydrolase activator NlpD
VKRWIIALIAILAILTTYGADSFATTQEIQKYQNELKKLQADMKKLDEQQRSLSTKQKTVVQRIGNIETNIRGIETDIASISGQITTTEGVLGTTMLELIEAETNISEKKEVLSKRIRVMYKTGHVGYLEVMLGSFDFEDMLSRVDMLQKIYKHDTTLLEDMQKQRNIVAEKKTALEKQKQELESLKRSLSVKQSALSLDLTRLESEQKNLKKDLIALEEQEDKLNEDAKKVTKMITSLKSSGKFVGGRMLWPTPGYTRISSYYGYRFHPVYKKNKLHTGIDVAAPFGAKVVAALDGTVIYSDWFGGYGKVVMIDHGGGHVTLYAHNSALLVSNGEKVTKGQQISKVGSTGISTGAHLHFEVRINGKHVDPVPWVSK